jgi:glycosyltransferase involved in cell wall biosynthesis
LAEALQSLAGQTAASSLYEVIVVDNNSTDGTEETASQFAARHPNFRTVKELQQGLSHARNRGWSEASAEWVAYMDDDARASTNFVERLLTIIDSDSFDAFGGVYLPWYRDGRNKWFLDHYASNADIQSSTGEMLDNTYFAGGNCAFRKDVLSRADGFSDTVGMSGTRIAYGEETMLIRRLRKLGFRIGFDPDLTIAHYVGANKQTVSWFFKSSYARGRDSWAVFEQEVTLARVGRALAEVFLLPVIRIPKNLRSLFTKDSYVQNFVIDTFSPSAFALAVFVEGVRRLLRRSGSQSRDSSTS